MTLSPGTRLGPYEITAPIGAGGMGEVYKARDTRLGRTVAIKVLPEGVASDPDRRRRFEQEARTVSSLNHPNMCVLYDVGADHGMDFLVMEYIEGEPLASRIGPGGLPVRESLSLAIQMADAVSAAHQRGIIHRDLKPANIMVTDECRVKVLDFGLARLKPQIADDGEATRTAAALTGEGRIVGTVSYMSPEQAEGRVVDHRSDIFSLGVMTYEMVTGERPFKGDTTVSVLSAILKDTPRPIRETKPEIPHELERVITRCLTKDREHRYQSAKDLRNALEEISRESDSGRLATASGSAPPAVQRPRAREWWMMAAAVMALAAGVWWGAGRWSGSAATALAFNERDWILIADWDNRTGDPVFDRSLETGITVSLQQSRYVNVFPRTRVPDTLTRMKKPPSATLDENLAREVALREGLKAVVVCRISGTGAENLLTAEIVDPVSQRTVASDAVRALGRNQVLSAVDTLADRTRRRLGESLASIQQAQTALPRATTESLEALTALAESRRVDSSAEREQLLKQALQLDPDFAMAHADLGVAYHTANRRPEGEEHFKKALDLLDHLTVREQLWIKAVVEDWRGNREQGIANYKTYVSQYPDDSRAWFRLGYTYMITARRLEAVQAFEQALRINPSDASSRVNIATCYKGLNEYQKADAAYQQAFQRRPELLTGIYINREYGFMLVKMGQLDKATQVFQKAISADDTEEKGKGYRSLGLLDMYRGQYTNAATHLKEAILLNKAGGKGFALSEFRDHMYLAQVSRTRQVWNVYDQEMAAAGRLVQANTFGPDWLLLIGTELARRGRSSEATRLLQQLSRVVGDPVASDSVARSNRGDQASYLYLKGEIEVAQGRYDEAIASFERGGKTEGRDPNERLARAYRLSGKLDQAIGSYEEYMKMNLVDMESWLLARYELAQVYELKGMQDKAVGCYEQFVNMWKGGDQDLPPLVDARRRLAKLNAASAPTPRQPQP